MHRTTKMVVSALVLTVGLAAPASGQAGDDQLSAARRENERLRQQAEGQSQRQQEAAQRTQSLRERALAGDFRGPLVSFEFPGGTVAEFAALLRQQSEQPVNIAVSPRAAGITVPPMSMESVHLLDALSSLQIVPELGSRQRIAVQTLGASGQMVGGPGAAAFAIGLQETQRAGGAPPPSVEVLNLRDLIGGELRPEVVLSAVEAALDLVPSDAEPELRFHQESGLLFVKGSAVQITSALQTIRQLERSVQMERRSAATPEHRRQLEELRGRQGQLQSAAIQARLELADAQDEVEIVDAGGLEGEERRRKMRAARERYLKAHARNESIQSELGSVTSRIHILESAAIRGAMEAGAEADQLRMAIHELQQAVQELRSRLDKAPGQPRQ